LGVKLAELGIRRWESHRYQRLAEIPELVLQRYVTETRDAHREITTAGLLRFARQHVARVGGDPSVAAPAGRSCKEPWSVDEAVTALTRAVADIARRWPMGEEQILTTTLHDLAHDMAESLTRGGV
jgi:hypothetical protein